MDPLIVVSSVRVLSVDPVSVVSLMIDVSVDSSVIKVSSVEPVPEPSTVSSSSVLRVESEINKILINCFIRSSISDL